MPIDIPPIPQAVAVLQTVSSLAMIKPSDIVGKWKIILNGNNDGYIFISNKIIKSNSHAYYLTSIGGRYFDGFDAAVLGPGEVSIVNIKKSKGIGLTKLNHNTFVFNNGIIKIQMIRV